MENTQKSVALCCTYEHWQMTCYGLTKDIRPSETPTYQTKCNTHCVLNILSIRRVTVMLEINHIKIIMMIQYNKVK